MKRLPGGRIPAASRSPLDKVKVTGKFGHIETATSLRTSFNPVPVASMQEALRAFGMHLRTVCRQKCLAQQDLA